MRPKPLLLKNINKSSSRAPVRGVAIQGSQKKLDCFALLAMTLLLLSLHLPLHAETAPQAQTRPTHGIAIFGDLKYPEGFTHYDYANPNAPKGGNVKLAAIGSFDSFNPFVIKGNAATGSGMLHCTLLDIAQDEPFSLYGYLAEKVEVAPDHRSVTFTLNKGAKFSDGTPVTADDVIFSFNTHMQKGIPLFSQYYKDVKKVEKAGPDQVRFLFSTDRNRELPAILGQLPAFYRAYFTKHDFEAADLIPPVGCGPYKIKDFQAGQIVTYERISDWWGKNLPTQKGQNNFDITYVYYRDPSVQFEGFKGGDYDFRVEGIAKNWTTGYKVPAVKDGKIVLKEVPNQVPQGTMMFAFNTRRPLFKTPKVRQALTEAFDFEWINKNLFFNSYVRSQSYFNNSDMASTGLPEGEELALLEPFKDQLPSELFTKEFKLPVSNGSGRDRSLITKAAQLLKEAGWIIKKGQRVSEKTEKPFTFELLLYDPSFERVALALQRNLKSLGIKMTIRTVTPSQYQERVQRYEFDMIFVGIPETETPGNEQRDFWVSKYADIPGGRNYAGIKDPVVDKLVALLLDSPDRPTLRTHVHALDRVLLWGYYGIPGWYSKTSRFAYWNKFGRPDKAPKDGVGFNAWWVDPTLEAKLKR